MITLFVDALVILGIAVVVYLLFALRRGFGWVPLVLLFFSGCSTCKPDCREMSGEMCQSLTEDCARINKMMRSQTIFTPYLPSEWEQEVKRAGD